jgi:hypothetical protein
MISAVLREFPFGAAISGRIQAKRQLDIRN